MLRRCAATFVVGNKAKNEYCGVVVFFFAFFFFLSRRRLLLCRRRRRLRFYRIIFLRISTEHIAHTRGKGETASANRSREERVVRARMEKMLNDPENIHTQ